MKKLMFAMTVLSMLGLSVACNRGDKDKANDSSKPQMEESNSKDDSMNSGSDSLDEEKSDMNRGFNDIDKEEEEKVEDVDVEETKTYDR